jgi:osmotically-inducible protein OsmY
MTFVRIALTALLVGAYTTVLAENGNNNQPTMEAEPMGDLALLSEIRREIMADSQLSSAAKNVKITARQGVVTLSGSVHSVAEKNAFEDKAASLAGKKNVRNELSVQP